MSDRQKILQDLDAISLRVKELRIATEDARGLSATASQKAKDAYEALDKARAEMRPLLAALTGERT